MNHNTDKLEHEEEIIFSDFDYTLPSIIETDNFDKFICKFDGNYYDLIEDIISYTNYTEEKMMKKMLGMLVSNVNDDEIRDDFSKFLKGVLKDINDMDKDYLQYSKKMHSSFADKFPNITKQQLEETNKELNKIDKFLLDMQKYENKKKFNLEEYISKTIQSCKSDLDVYDCFRCIIDNKDSVDLTKFTNTDNISDEVSLHIMKYISSKYETKE
jgi:ferritin-like metal-binding protein YciE